MYKKFQFWFGQLCGKQLEFTSLVSVMAIDSLRLYARLWARFLMSNTDQNVDQYILRFLSSFGALNRDEIMICAAWLSSSSFGDTRFWSLSFCSGDFLYINSLSSSVVLLNSSCDCDVPVWLSHSFGPSVPTRARRYLKSRIQSQNIFFLTVIGKDKCLNDLCLHDFVRDLIHDLIQNNTDPRTASDYSKFLK